MTDLHQNINIIYINFSLFVALKKYFLEEIAMSGVDNGTLPSRKCSTIRLVPNSRPLELTDVLIENEVNDLALK